MSFARAKIGCYSQRLREATKSLLVCQRLGATRVWSGTSFLKITHHFAVSAVDFARVMFVKPSSSHTALGEVLRTSGRWLEALQILEDVLSSCKLDAIVISVTAGAALKVRSCLAWRRMSRRLLGAHL